MVDLHVHTTCSDGQYSPADIIKLAANAKIRTLAVTDHDSVGAVRECSLLAVERGIDFISGVELSVRGNRELHILGYNINCTDAALLCACVKFENERRKRLERVLDYLLERGIKLTIEDVQNAAESRAFIGRVHIAAAMQEKGYVADIREAFDKHIGTSEFDKVERPKPSDEEGISLIRNAGGVPVLAHPGMLKLDSDKLEELVRKLMGFGLVGMECFYSMHTDLQTKEYVDLANKLGLLVTCGSDFHGQNVKPEIKIGIGTGNLASFCNDKIAEQLRSAGR